MGLVVLIGGARSGKSLLALRLAGKSGAPVVFVATGEARDQEMADRIARHQAERPAGWKTLEEPVRLREAVEGAPSAACVVVDCLSLWVSNLIEQIPAEEIEAEAVAVAQIAAGRGGVTIAVTNEVGLGIVPMPPLSRAYRDVLGRVNAIWAAAADEAFFVVAGRALRLQDGGSIDV